MRFEPFEDRRAAGRALAGELRHLGYAGRDDVVVLGLPRGGIPVAFEVASAFGSPLDVFVVRKLGTPGQEELAMGAIASGGVLVVNEDVIHSMGITQRDISAAAAAQREELARREKLYRGSRSLIHMEGRVAILIDDGLATGATMRAAIAALRQHRPARIVVAVPVGAADTCQAFREERQCDELVCLMTPVLFFAVGQWYVRFDQTSDTEVRELLAKAAPPPPNDEKGDDRIAAAPWE